MRTEIKRWKQGKSLWGDSAGAFSSSLSVCGSKHHGITTPSKSSHAIASANDIRPKAADQNEKREA